MGGELYSRPFRKHVMERLCNAIDSLRRTYTEPKLLVMGDFNDYADSPSLLLAYEHGLFNVSAGVQGRNGAKGPIVIMESGVASTRCSLVITYGRGWLVVVSMMHPSC